ncbi:MAG: tyrosine-protein phosphatase, partial [Acinetobacter sp.]|nr:tyrosine-protein phosphatase [Acinetobacter sp.]
LKLRRGVIYRSNYLPLNETDLETFKTLEIKTVYDLRTNSEREKKPRHFESRYQYYDGKYCWFKRERSTERDCDS